MKPLRTLALILAFSLAPALALAQPVVVAGNPTCSDLGYSLGFKPQPEPPPSGTYPFPGDPGNTVTITSNGTLFDWASTLGIDAVIVKGGPNANVYDYNPESFGDTQLHSPVNPNNGQFFAISHIEFCYDYEVGVRKDAEPSFNRTWEWTIEKVADQTEITLAPGQAEATVNYTVTVTPVGFVDSDWAVEGTIWIHNPAPFNATITSVADVFEGSAASVDCGVTFPYTLGPGADLHCTYYLDLDGAVEGTNTATVTTSGAVGGGTGTAEVVFPEEPTSQIDECVDVFDQVSGDFPVGFLGTVCADEIVASGVFDYDINVAEVISEDVCEGGIGTATTTFENTASLVTNDQEITAEDTWVIDVFVECTAGCTLTQGYWKTHSQEGPAPYDAAWANLGPSEEATPFFLSGQTWYQVFWTPPKGNAYYNLAHQYMAAVLNSLNGADVPADVQTAINTATTLFNTYTPAQIAALKGKAGNDLRDQFIHLGGTLGSYNEGSVGPGHCTETTPASLSRVLEVENVAAVETVKPEQNPAPFSISNYPDPFNPTTTLRFELPEAVHVSIIVYDVLGRQMARLADGVMEAGVHEVAWNASSLPSGTYFYMMRAGQFAQTKTMVLAK